MARRWLGAAALGIGVAGGAYWRRVLTFDGAVAAAGVGCIVFARGGLPGSGRTAGLLWQLERDLEAWPISQGRFALGPGQGRAPRHMAGAR